MLSPTPTDGPGAGRNLAAARRSSGSPRQGLLDADGLRAAVERGAVDAVLVAFPDMQGRLLGKRVQAHHFLDRVATHGTEACNYLLAVDVDMRTVGGYRLSSWDQGYGDFVLVPDLTSLRLLPWHDALALVLCDVVTTDGAPVAVAPRQVLRDQCQRLARYGWRSLVGTELEFQLFEDTYEAAFEKGYTGITPATPYNTDYSLLATRRASPVLERICTAMGGAGMQVESLKGECNLGQFEIAFVFDEALATCDNHAVYKLGAKEIAAQAGMSLTFMAKLDEREGNSCHLHVSLRDADGAPVFADARGAPTPVFEHFLAGQLHALGDLALFFAPNVNSYKRYVDRSFAPTALCWGWDNRTCALRVVGRGPSLRIENRIPGGDANPYLAVAATIAAGLFGIEHELPLEPPVAGDAYTTEAPTLPTTLRHALERWEGSPVAHAAFGDETVSHYATMARVELAAFDRAVTDWERVRGFERL